MSMLINVVSKNLTNQRPPIPTLSIQRKKTLTTFPSPVRNITATAWNISGAGTWKLISPTPKTTRERFPGKRRCQSATSCWYVALQVTAGTSCL